MGLSLEKSKRKRYIKWWNRQWIIYHDKHFDASRAIPSTNSPFFSKPITA
jgi:hypothetical protein